MPQRSSSGFLIPCLLLAATTAAALATPAAVAAPGPSAALEVAVETVSGALRQAWNGDPATAALPWPTLRLVPSGSGVLASCPSAGGASTDTSALFCEATGELLLDAKGLSSEQERYGSWGLAYWIATGLGQFFLARQNSGSASPGPAVNLQAVCLAGVLLDSSPGLTPRTPAQKLSPARSAYGSVDASLQGTRSQRAYALLSGFGATASPCTATAMEGLAADRVGDPKLLGEVGEDPGNRALSSVSDTLNMTCRKPLRCPRRIREVYAASGP
ncbi:hypothetical protein I1E95_16530 [Synechococcus sp. CBW1107]|uniref:hypothetical protein n=1 Tax=Synechococcus sp. CBW1107 TaxID=2789857 RepID=UPI0018CD3E3C|nr:hypothetical protein [Synechococcus sp. CBW1107]QPN56631.1 hypothetical protein I1E95_16530 [Synechococcus sp. CBW1107]